MLYQDYVNLTQQISPAVDDKKFEIALQLLDKLIQTDLPDIDKSSCASIAEWYGTRRVISTKRCDGTTVPSNMKNLTIVFPLGKKRPPICFG